MFSKILIANRGEIACRVIRTAREMGIVTVAVYSEADRKALHVEMADTAVLIGPPPVAESYLQAGRIIEAALATGAQAIHPGYGFLSENPEFVEKVEAAGLVFIGPTAGAIRAMGLKDAAKRVMADAGVPVVPGYHGKEQDAAVLAASAGEIGYPVLIKARAGGGGKGMRRVDDPGGFADALAGARREAEASFGDPAVLVEKLVPTARHIEVQVFGDSHGNIVHLFERDCSLQRRHQKVIEEAPAPGMTDAMRTAMGGAAVKAAQAIGYEGAGTVEFIVDASRELDEKSFYFMEMNTRLQVEHPVTEAITGLDLVEWQIRVAAGERLPLTQDDLSINGHAVEARVYAEDPSKGFLPATGRLAHLVLPVDARVDTGVRAGDVITPFYDPMIAKVVCHGPTREIALARLGRALSQTEAVGCVTNLGFLARLIRNRAFIRAEMDTGLIGREEEGLLRVGAVTPALLAVAAVTALELTRPAEGPFAGFGSWRLWGEACHAVGLLDGTAEHLCLVYPGPTTSARVEVAGAISEVDWDAGGFSVRSAAGEARLRAIRTGSVVTVFDGAETVSFTLLKRLSDADVGASGGDAVQAPMSGVVKAVHAVEAQAVRRGEPLMIIEAMKMEHTLTAPRDGVIAAIHARPGEQVDEAALLIAFDPVPDAIE
ncbi:MAG: acetyl/propionyl/methylcrotonyl-CoA carboxylase subunit alpha [Pseudomonadota bacterium]